MPTIAGMRRRGYTPESIRAFCDLIGIAKANSTVDIGKLEFCVRDDLNFRSPRVMCVLDPLKVVLTNLDEERTLDCPSWPHDVGKEGSRPVPLTRELYIEREDFQEDPEPGFFRLAPGREVRLRYAHVIRCDEVVKDEAGEVVELRCSVDLATLGANPADGRKVKGTIHWVSATRSAAVEVRVYDRLFKVKNPGIVRDFREDINPASLTVLKAARIEPSALDGAASHYQFERHGYFFVDPVDSAPGAPVFNRVVDLKDSWAAKAEAATQGAGAAEAVAGRSKKAETRPDRRTPAELRELARAANPGLQARLERFVSAWGLDPKDADVLTGDEALADFYEAAVAVHAEPTVVAKWVVNEVLREVKERPVGALPFDGARFGRLVAMVGSGALTATLAKEVFAQMARTGEDPRVIVEQRGLDKADDGEAIKAALVALLEAHPQEVARYKGGARNLMGFFTGLAMKATGGKAPAKVVQAVLGELLG
jgi:glutaminyl-tRNA synthetase